MEFTPRSEVLCYHTVIKSILFRTQFKELLYRRLHFRKGSNLPAIVRILAQIQSIAADDDFLHYLAYALRHLGS